MERALNGFVALLTDGTSENGREIAQELHNRGAKIIVLCPPNSVVENSKEIIKNSA